MRMWIGVGILGAFFAAIAVWPAPENVISASPAPVITSSPDSEAEPPPLTPEELAQDSRDLSLPPPPPPDASAEADQAYLERLAAIIQSQNAEHAKKARRLKQDYTRAQRQKRREERKEEARKREEEQKAARERAQVERKAARNH